jgi:hypothetical protein
MKFDVARAMATVQTFDFPRPALGEGPRQGSSLLADRLEASGWVVERCQTRDAGRTSFLAMGTSLIGVALAFSLWRALRITFPVLPVAGRLAAFVCALLVLVGVVALAVGRRRLQRLVEWLASQRSREAKKGMENLVGAHPSDADPPARVVFLTYLDAPARAGKWEDALWTVVFVALALVVSAETPAAWGPWLLVGFELLLVICYATVCFPLARRSPGDNGSGLALLAELAQALPPRIHERLEVRLAAVGGHSVGQLGALSLAEQARRCWPAKPTLFVNFDAPGQGTCVILVGRGPELEIAESAAKDLWLPHRLARWSLRPLDHRPFAFCGFPALSLAGDSRAARIDPAALAATAQLATEIALRWARTQGPAAQGASLSKSSQKPG